MRNINKVFRGPAFANCPQKAEGLMASDVLPCTIVTKAADGTIDTLPSAGAGEAYVMDVAFTNGGKIGEAVASGTTGEAYVPLSGQFFSVMVETGQTVYPGAALTIGTTDGVLTLGTPALFYAGEDYTTTASEPVLARKA